MILREREYVHNRANQRGSQGELEDEDIAFEDIFDEAGDSDARSNMPEGAEGDESGDQGNSNNSAQGEAEVTSTAGGGVKPDSPQSARQGDYGNHGQPNQPPADIPSGSDDDVVARQIREAAMNETDPVLREKLWDEYRKYKTQ